MNKREYTRKEQSFAGLRVIEYYPVLSTEEKNERDEEITRACIRIAGQKEAGLNAYDGKDDK